MLRAPVLAVASLSAASVAGVLAFNPSPHSADKKPTPHATKTTPQKLWASRVLTQKVPFREIRSLNWMADNRRLWIAKTNFAEARNSITTWNILSNEQTTREVTSSIETQNFLPTAYRDFPISFHYAELPDHFWSAQKHDPQRIKEAEEIKPLLQMPQFLVGWDSDREGLKIIWRDAKSLAITCSFHLKLPRGYDYYIGGGCGELGPHIRLSRDGKIGFLSLFGDDSVRRILVFEPLNGKTLRILKLLKAPAEFDSFEGFQITPDARHLLTFKNVPDSENPESIQKTVEWRDAKDGRVLHSWPAYDRLGRVVLSDDGKFFAMYFNEKNIVKIYNAETAALVREIKQGKPNKFNDEIVMKFSPDNRYLATSDKNYLKGESVTVWRLH